MMKHVELYACIYVKEFPAQALMRLRSEMRNQPCVVMEGEPPLQYVCSLNTKARNRGIAPNMTRVEVETFPSIVLLSRSQAEESAAKAALLECAGAFSPRVEEQSEGSSFLCVIDIAGTDKLFGPTETLAKMLLNKIYALGFIAKIAISSNFYTAVCFAKGSSSRTAVTIVPDGDELEALAVLPLEVLGLAEESMEIFSLWGIRTLGMLAELPEKDLVARMGQEGKRLRQLARGELPHLFLPIESAFALEECMELDLPVEILDSLLFVVGIMLEQLILRATARVLALASITITLTLEGGISHTRTVRSALPSNDRQLWIKLLHLDLQAHLPQTAILSVKLTAEPGSTSKVQLGLFSPQLPEPMRLDVTLARIRSIVGEGSVGRVVLKDTHQFDDFYMESFSLPSTPPLNIVSTPPRIAMRQLRPAENIQITLCDKRPMTFSFRDKRFNVERAYGPWQTSGDWWNSSWRSLEQWDLVGRAQDDTMLCCCIVQDLTKSCWQMVSLYD